MIDNDDDEDSEVMMMSELIRRESLKSLSKKTKKVLVYTTQTNLWYDCFKNLY